ncbi:hypothetical protein QQ056_14040 [Oscillatoria laete-virens NRMC-F 0139]|nr:hypothetical protein [Oscillatoria laete-virens]MDL5054658.1 hypothetical protein [Oscillatoria laete-virens NRMC-F 0139]
MKTIRTWLLLGLFTFGISGIMYAQALDEMHSDIMKDFGKVTAENEALEKGENKKDKKSESKATPTVEDGKKSQKDENKKPESSVEEPKNQAQK